MFPFLQQLFWAKYTKLFCNFVNFSDNFCLARCNIYADLPRVPLIRKSWCESCNREREVSVKRPPDELPLICSLTNLHHGNLLPSTILFHSPERKLSSIWYWTTNSFLSPQKPQHSLLAAPIYYDCQKIWIWQEGCGITISSLPRVWLSTNRELLDNKWQQYDNNMKICFHRCNTPVLNLKHKPYFNRVAPVPVVFFHIWLSPEMNVLSFCNQAWLHFSRETLDKIQL